MKRALVIALMVILSAGFARADWTRDIQSLLISGTDTLTPRTLDRGAMIADVVPLAGWPGKEVVQASHDRIFVMQSTNSQSPLQLEIPPLWTPVVPEADPSQRRLWFEDAPAIGDVDGDGDLDIVAGATSVIHTQENGDFRYSAVVWWTWNSSLGQFDDVHHFYENDENPSWQRYQAYQIPTICHPAWTDGAPAIAFFGLSYVFTQSWTRYYKLMLFDISNPLDIRNTSFPVPYQSGCEYDCMERHFMQGEYTVAAGDLNNDGFDELVTADCRAVHVWETTSGGAPTRVFLYDVQHQGAYPNYQLANGGLALADVEADGSLKILVPRWENPGDDVWINLRLLCLDSSLPQDQNPIRVYGAYETPANPYDEAHPVPAVANLSAWFTQQIVGTLNPLMMTDNDSRQYLPTGDLLPNPPAQGWPFRHHVSPPFSSEHVGVALADVYGMDRPQIIFSGKDAAGPSSHKLYDFMDARSPIAQVTQTAVPNWSASVGVTHRGVPAIDDLDGDGLTEMVMVVKHHADGEANEHHEVMLSDLNVPYNRELVYWSQFQNGPQHTGLYAQPVSGNQPLSEMEWSGRVVVHDWYTIQAGQLLRIKPGTVVEFTPGAWLLVDGTLWIGDANADSVYLKPDGTSDWGGIYVGEGAELGMTRAVVHGAGSIYAECYGGTSPLVTIVDSRIYDMEYGLDLYGLDAVQCYRTIIADCDYYGIRGTEAAGYFEDVTIRDCGRSGIYWVGDYPTILEPPVFYRCIVTQNGIGAGRIGGGYFNATTADLRCCQFEYNQTNQIVCENNADIIMNGRLPDPTANKLFDDTGIAAWCINPFPDGYSPLLTLNASLPQLVDGVNEFRFDADGTYIRATNMGGQAVNVNSNYFNPDGSPPAPGNNHFCPNDGFVGAAVGTGQALCLSNGGGGGTEEGAMAAYQEAATAEKAGNDALAQVLYQSVYETHPVSSEAIWAARGYLRSGTKVANARELHDTLAAITTPNVLRLAAQREAAWALISGRNYTDAHSMLESIRQADESQIQWADVVSALLDLMENGRGRLDSPEASSPQSRAERVSNIHDRIHRLMGRETDNELREQLETPQSHDLARAYPNPFNSTVTIELELPDAVSVRLEVFNLLGQKVATLADQPMQAGAASFQWNASAASAGVYFYRLTTDNRVETHKLLLLK